MEEVLHSWPLFCVAQHQWLPNTIHNVSSWWYSLKPIPLSCVGLQVSLIQSLQKLHWNLQSADWSCYGATVESSINQIPPYMANYRCFVGLLISAAKLSTARDFRKGLTPCCTEENEAFFWQYQANKSCETATALLEPLHSARRKRWCETVTALDFTRSNCKAWKLLHLLDIVAPAAYKPPRVSTDATSAQLMANSCANE